MYNMVLGPAVFQQRMKDPQRRPEPEGSAADFGGSDPLKRPAFIAEKGGLHLGAEPIEETPSRPSEEALES